MTDQDKPQGPTDPSGPGGLDAPAPPGGPQRTDAPAGPDTPGEARQDPGPGTTRVTRPEGDSEAGVAVRTHSDDRDPSGDRDRAEQIENAETSLDEPSDGSGGE